MTKRIELAEFCEATMNSLLGLCPNFGFGGIVVPQLGQLAGDSIPIWSVPMIANEQELSIILAHINVQLADPLQKSSIVKSIPKSLFSSQAYCVALPIAASFDKAIGGLWILVSDGDSVLAEKLLSKAAAMIAEHVFAEKAVFALDTLGGTKWWEITTLDDMALTLATRCKEATACLDVVIWESDKKQKTLKTIASTCCRPLDMPLGVGIAGKCALNSEVIRVGDLLDEDGLRPISSKGVRHRDVVLAHKWRSAVFVPFDRGGNIVGVLAIYGTRPNGLNNLDASIATAFANEFCLAYPYIKQADLVAVKERQLALVAPMVDQVKISIENIHDVTDHLLGALFSLDQISKTPIDAKRLAENAATRIKAVRGLIQELRTSIQGAKKKPYLPKKTEVGKLLKLFEKTVSKQALEAAITVHVTIPSEPVFCNIDQNKFDRALLNLFDNAKYFLRMTSRQPKHINVTLAVSDNVATIRFRDNGPGIEEGQISTVFDYFVSTKADDGLGLGLAIVREVVDLHGGSVAVVSRWGESTEFCIVLPLVD